MEKGIQLIAQKSFDERDNHSKEINVGTPNSHGGIQTGIGTQVSFHMNSQQNTVMDFNYEN